MAPSLLYTAKRTHPRTGERRNGVTPCNSLTFINISFLESPFRASSASASPGMSSSATGINSWPCHQEVVASIFATFYLHRDLRHSSMELTGALPNVIT